jgi:hypothetical protein
MVGMQMTNALRSLMKAHSEDTEFPYMDFVGAFLLVEKWISRSGKDTLARFSSAGADEILGLPLGDSMDDLKLGYVLSLLRSHAQEVYSDKAIDGALLH